MEFCSERHTFSRSKASTLCAITGHTFKLKYLVKVFANVLGDELVLYLLVKPIHVHIGEVSIIWLLENIRQLTAIATVFLKKVLKD